jgi:hypothetical protein
MIYQNETWADLAVTSTIDADIEPALSAWESGRSGPMTALTWGFDAPLVTVIIPAIPGLIAPPIARGPMALAAAGLATSGRAT